VPEPEVNATAPEPEPEVNATSPEPEPEVNATSPEPEPEVNATSPVPEPPPHSPHSPPPPPPAEPPPSHEPLASPSNAPAYKCESQCSTPRIVDKPQSCTDDWAVNRFDCRGCERCQTAPTEMSPPSPAPLASPSTASAPTCEARCSIDRIAAKPESCTEDWAVNRFDCRACERCQTKHAGETTALIVRKANRKQGQVRVKFGRMLSEAVAEPAAEPEHFFGFHVYVSTNARLIFGPAEGCGIDLAQQSFQVHFFVWKSSGPPMTVMPTHTSQLMDIPQYIGASSFLGGLDANEHAHAQLEQVHHFVALNGVAAEYDMAVMYTRGDMNNDQKNDEIHQTPFWFQPTAACNGVAPVPDATWLQMWDCPEWEHI